MTKISKSGNVLEGILDQYPTFPELIIGSTVPADSPQQVTIPPMPTSRRVINLSPVLTPTGFDCIMFEELTTTDLLNSMKGWQTSNPNKQLTNGTVFYNGDTGYWTWLGQCCNVKYEVFTVSTDVVR